MSKQNCLSSNGCISDMSNVRECVRSVLARFWFGYDGMFYSSGGHSSVFCLLPRGVKQVWLGPVGKQIGSQGHYSFRPCFVFEVVDYVVVYLVLSGSQTPGLGMGKIDNFSYR